MVTPRLDAASEVPLYRQVFDYLRGSIESGYFAPGSRLPAMRDLAHSLNLNRSTIAAAYELLEAEGLVRTQVGKGSFVIGPSPGDGRLDWNNLLGPLNGDTPPAAVGPDTISFASARPSEQLFPMAELQETVEEVVHGKGAPAILQIGPPSGYPPLRYYLIEEARQQGLMGPDDDLLVTSGCQQGLDLLDRVLVRGTQHSVALEDPVYPGVRNLFQRSGARVVGIPVGDEGVLIEELERVLEQERPRLLVLTPNFQNPTGATIPLEQRKAVADVVRRLGVVLVENDIYGSLRYRGEDVTPIKNLDEWGHVVRLHSFSKMAFPGLRVGWVLGPAPLIARMAEAKQLCDLHTDQLAQAVLLRFVETGRLQDHLKRIREAGRARLNAVLNACQEFLPEGTEFTRPEGGMNLWVTLPEPMDAEELLPRAQMRRVTYLPGKYFWISRRDRGTLRLSFAGLTPEEIGQGLRLLGDAFGVAAAQPAGLRMEPAIL